MNTCIKEIKELCLRLLAGREHSKKELLQKLILKGYERDSILAVIDELASEGWQDDLRYAESYARSRIDKGFGPVHIAYGLRQNGIDIADNQGYRTNKSGSAFNLDALVQAAAGGWMDVLEQVYRKKYGLDKQLDVGERARRSRFLLQRGFTGTMISALFEHLNYL